ncbi:hypothetical protein L1987_37388 [Smallanthus sonchifolius]|uniref:Uncharacterized protein n=1 Tax=Smallanthus sonchifolius TaxID=185202 RepID=A0ACB9HGX5_9ASTR|nr:hypothetical protein L1987_37388 [Smallanthus sonchifolius]
MDSYSLTSPVCRPEEETDWEEDTGSPVHRSPTPAAARPRTSEFERQRIEQGLMHDLQRQGMNSLANQLGYQKELISILEAVLDLRIILLLVESYRRR